MGLGILVILQKQYAAGADSRNDWWFVHPRTEEAPGEMELYPGRTYKPARGMGSVGAMNKGRLIDISKIIYLKMTVNTAS